MIVWWKSSNNPEKSLSFSEKIKKFENYALEYYANIVSSFSDFVNRGLEKLSALPIDIICPSHGLIWWKNCDKIVNDYKKYASYNLDKDALEKALEDGTISITERKELKEY